MLTSLFLFKIIQIALSKKLKMGEHFMEHYTQKIRHTYVYYSGEGEENKHPLPVTSEDIRPANEQRWES